MAINRNVNTSGGVAQSVDQVSRIDSLETRTDALEAIDTVYSGLVYSASTSSLDLPSGWSVTNPSVGNYTITHNLGLNDATDGIITTSVIQSDRVPNNNGKNANYFQINIRDFAGVSQDASFNFILSVKAQ